MPCFGVFVQDPEVYLRTLGVTLECPVRPGRTATLASDHRARVNHEVYFFSSRAALGKFMRNPLAYCGTLTDPVTGRRFRPDGGSPRHDHRGQAFFFDSEESREAFLRDPGRYARPVRTMPSAPGPPAD